MMINYEIKIACTLNTYSILFFGFNFIVYAGFTVPDGGESSLQNELDGAFLDSGGVLVLVDYW